MIKAAIVVKDLIKRYGDLTAVDGVSFEVYENEIFGIVGPNGAGKTTMIECLEGLKFPFEGFVRIFNLDPKADGYKLKKIIGIQLQEGNFPDKIKVREVFELFTSFYAHSLPVESLLKKVGLLDKVDSYFENLSGGQKQRMSIALALVNDPQVVFFDELTTGLDPHARRVTWKMVRSIRETGKTVIIVTHFMEEAEQLCDRVAIVDRGKIVALDTPANLRRNVGEGLRISFPVDDSSIITKLENIDRCQFAVSNQDISIRCADYKAIGEVIQILGENNYNFHDVMVSRPTLEDVYLHITGREMRE